MLEGYYESNPQTAEDRTYNRLVRVLEFAVFHEDLTCDEAAEIITEYRLKTVQEGAEDTSASAVPMNGQFESATVPTADEIAAERFFMRPSRFYRQRSEF